MNPLDCLSAQTAHRCGVAREKPPQQWPGNPTDAVTVYLLCGHKRYTMPDKSKKWMHYVGATRNLAGRIYAHRTGRSGAKLPAAMIAQGIKLRLAQSWHFTDAQKGWEFERQLKERRNHAYLCKYCEGRYRKKYQRNALKRRQANAKTITKRPRAKRLKDANN